MKPKRHYTITEAAHNLGITREAVWKAVKSRKLKARLGTLQTKGWLIAAESLEAYEVSTSHQERSKKTLDRFMVMNLLLSRI
jgi:predicted DNA-binding protein (UPF0251 family)